MEKGKIKQPVGELPTPTTGLNRKRDYGTQHDLPVILNHACRMKGSGKMKWIEALRTLESNLKNTHPAHIGHTLQALIGFTKEYLPGPVTDEAKSLAAYYERELTPAEFELFMVDFAKLLYYVWDFIFAFYCGAREWEDEQDDKNLVSDAQMGAKEEIERIAYSLGFDLFFGQHTNSKSTLVGKLYLDPITRYIQHSDLRDIVEMATRLTLTQPQDDSPIDETLVGMESLNGMGGIYERSRPAPSMSRQNLRNLWRRGRLQVRGRIQEGVVLLSGVLLVWQCVGAGLPLWKVSGLGVVLTIFCSALWKLAKRHSVGISRAPVPDVTK